jgi:hypothetical protein
VSYEEDELEAALDAALDEIDRLRGDLAVVEQRYENVKRELMQVADWMRQMPRTPLMEGARMEHEQRQQAMNSARQYTWTNVISANTPFKLTDINLS